MTLSELRRRIDALDDQILDLLNRRMRNVQAIGHQKKASKTAVYVPARETQVLARLARLNHGPLPEKSLRAIYREVMSASLNLERPLKVAYFGLPATFTHQAARSKFGSSVEYLSCETISDVFRAVENGRADYGVVPSENSTEGAVTHTLDEFMATPLKVCAEIYLAVNQNLLARRGRKTIRRIYSHPQVFGQCRQWLQKNMPGVELIPVASTARAAEMAAREPAAAALASDLAAEMYGLRRVAENIQDYGGNMTRFLVIGPHAAQPTKADKTSLLFAVKHKVGALHSALATFRRHRINMTKIESRPSKTKAWEYCFFVDIEGHAEDKTIEMALKKMAEHCTMMTVLGSYPRAGQPG